MQESSDTMPNQLPVASHKAPGLKGVSLRKMNLSGITSKALVASASLLLAACAGTGLSGKTPEQLVEQRAQQRLAALRAQDINTVMTYTTPTYRARVTPERYASRYAGVASWMDAQVDSVNCEEDRCNVTVMVTYQMNRPKMVNTRPLEEIWIKVDGSWYIYHQQ